MASLALSNLSVPQLIDAIILSPSFDVLIENVVQDFFIVPTPIVLGFLFELLDLLSVYPSTTTEWRAFVQQIYNTIGVTGPVVGGGGGLTIAGVINVLGNPATPATYPADWTSFVTANVANNTAFKAANNTNVAALLGNAGTPAAYPADWTSFVTANVANNTAFKATNDPNVLAYLSTAYARVGNWPTFMGQILNTANLAIDERHTQLVESLYRRLGTESRVFGLACAARTRHYHTDRITFKRRHSHGESLR